MVMKLLVIMFGMFCFWLRVFVNNIKTNAIGTFLICGILHLYGVSVGTIQIVAIVIQAAFALLSSMFPVSVIFLAYAGRGLSLDGIVLTIDELQKQIQVADAMKEYANRFKRYIAWKRDRAA